MKNITLKIDEATYDRARMEAARRKTSVSGLVREYLLGLDSGDDREARRTAALEQIYALATARARSQRAQPVKPLTREEAYAERLR